MKNSFVTVNFKGTEFIGKVVDFSEETQVVKIQKGEDTYKFYLSTNCTMEVIEFTYEITKFDKVEKHINFLLDNELLEDSTDVSLVTFGSQGKYTVCISYEKNGEMFEYFLKAYNSLKSAEKYAATLAANNYYSYNGFVVDMTDEYML